MNGHRPKRRPGAGEDARRPARPHLGRAGNDVAAPRPGVAGYRHRTNAAVTAGLGAITARDPLFDEQVVLQAARRALFFLFVAGRAGNDGRLRQVSTKRFWHTPAGEEVEQQAKTQAAAAQSMRRLGDSPQAAMVKGLRPMVLDYDAHDAELWSVQPNVDGVDRITVRLAYRGEAAVAGPGAALRARAMTGRMDLAASRLLRTQAESGAMPPADSARIATQGWYDFEFSRSIDAGSSTTDGTAARRCATCGAPYHSDLDVACRNCQAERATAEGGWKLDRSWLVVDTEARAGHGINRDRHNSAWALHGAGKIALKIGETIAGMTCRPRHVQPDQVNEPKPLRVCVTVEAPPDVTLCDQPPQTARHPSQYMTVSVPHPLGHFTNLEPVSQLPSVPPFYLRVSPPTLTPWHCE